MDFLRTYLAPTKALVDSDIMRHFASLVADINAYLFWNRIHIAYSDGSKRKLAICMGHTHKLIKHDDRTPIQQVLEAVIDEFLMNTPDEKRANKSYLLNKIDVKYINTGAGSGQSLEAEYVQDKFRWRTVEKQKKDDTFGLRENSKTGRSLNLRQNSVLFYEEEEGSVSLSYTTDDYCSPSQPSEF